MAEGFESFGVRKSISVKYSYMRQTKIVENHYVNIFYQSLQVWLFLNF